MPTNRPPDNSAQPRPQAYAWVIWIVAALFYSYEFFLRISPTVMVDDLMRSFHVSAETLGSLSAMYYYAYAIMQIPVGILLDRYGPRRLLTFAATMVALGSYLFATTNTLGIAEFGRVLMGIGSAFAFVGCLKLSAAWFPAKRFALVVGLTNMLGVIGAINGEAPLAYVVGQLGWRYTMHAAAIIGIALTILNLLIIRDAPYQQQISPREPLFPSNQELVSGIKKILRSKQTWLAACFGGLLVAPIAGFAELWSVPFLMQSYALTKPEAAGLSSVVFIGIAIGGPLNGQFSSWLGQRKLIMMIGAIGALFSLLAVIYVRLPSELLISVLLFCLGFFSSSMLLAFVVNCELHSKRISGVVIGFTNMLVMLGGTIFQPLIGFLLDENWQGKLTQGAHVFSLHDYHIALSLLPACQLLGIICVMFIRETYCCRVGEAVN